jgi:hypothetical protein
MLKTIEKYARENYLDEKKDNEDLFIFFSVVDKSK